jgi:hypothetical protein
MRRRMLELGAAQIEEAVLQSRLLGRVVLGKDVHRQRLAGTEQVVARDVEFDFSGGEVGVDRAFGPRTHLAVDADDRFLGQMRDGILKGGGGRDDDLRDAVVVAQVDEEDAAEIALVVDPAREADGLARERGVQFVAGVGAVRIGGHGRNSFRQD